MTSLLDLHIQNTIDRYFASAGFKDWLSRRVGWAMQGLEPGFKLADREAFTTTVALRIREKARRPIYFIGFRIWRARYSMDFCDREAERIVTEFLRNDGIKFGDPAYYWGDGAALADADMEYWETCP
jgi:hypothetical protein